MTENQPKEAGKKDPSNLEKVALLLWKNYLTQKRRWIQTVIDILVPVILVAIIAYTSRIRSNTDIQISGQRYAPFVEALDQVRDIEPVDSINLRLVFMPNNSIFTNLMDDISNGMGWPTAIGVKSIDEMQKTLVNQSLLAGIEFRHPVGTTELPKKLIYSLRFPAELRTANNNFTWPTHLLYSIRMPATQYYTDEKFINIQQQVAASFIKLSKGNATTVNIEFKPFPMPDIAVFDYEDMLDLALPLILVIILSFGFMNTVRLITTEKEKQLIHTMNMIGLKDWMHYLAWFIRSIIILTTTMALITVLLKMNFVTLLAPFPKSNMLFIFILLFFYSICIIMLAILISAFSSTAQKAANASIYLWLILTILPFIIVNLERDSTWYIAFHCLNPNFALIVGFRIIIRWESMGYGLTASNAFSSLGIFMNNRLAVGAVYGCLLFSAIMFGVIALNAEKILHQTSKITNLCKKKTAENVDEHEEIDESIEAESNIDDENFEKKRINESVGIDIRKLTKQFGNDKAAVNNLSLKIFNNQITCLLGHNGAGKTTVMSMLTGILLPTSGTIIINGHDLQTDKHSARKSMGYCPQHNIFFDDLTVGEHIQFYSRIKGLDQTEADKEVKRYTKLLELDDAVNMRTTEMSGGMQRNLSVIMTLCGQTKVILLDEPTSGMDNVSRRALWDILVAEKKDRTILLSTHFMDEADILSDRIAIMADGELKCLGSTYFLKQRFGVGYHITCFKMPRMYYTTQISRMLRKYQPGLQPEKQNETEVSYFFPENFVEFFGIIFTELELNAKRLKLCGFGISLNSLEDIFVQLYAAKNDAKKSPNQTSITLGADYAFVSGAALLISQTKAMFMKRFAYFSRTWVSYLLYNLIIILAMVLIFFNLQKYIPNAKYIAHLDMVLDVYPKRQVAILQNSGGGLADTYKKYLGNLPIDVETIDGNMTAALIQRANKSIPDYKYTVLTATEFISNEHIIIWYNWMAYHSMPLSLNLISNAVVKSTFSDEYSIEMRNAPLERIADSTGFIETASAIMASNFYFASVFSFVIITYVIMSIYSPSYLKFYFVEKESMSKYMQYLSGANMIIFWITSILWDLLLNLLTVIIIVGLLALSSQEGYNIGIVFGILFLYNFAMIPIISIFSLIFKTEQGKTFLILFNFIGVVILLAMYYGYRAARNTADGVNFANFDRRKFPFWPYPLCTMFDALFTLKLHDAIETNDTRILEMFNITIDEGNKILADGIFAFSNFGLTPNFLCMLISGAIAFTLVILIESGTHILILNLLKLLLTKTIAGVKWLWSKLVQSSKCCKRKPAEDGATNKMEKKKEKKKDKKKEKKKEKKKKKKEENNKENKEENKDGKKKETKKEKKKKNKKEEVEEVDDDVLHEKAYIDGMTTDELRHEVLVMQNVSKTYLHRNAIKNYSFTLDKGECFGVLGKSGAGKTTIFKMITGQTSISSGEIYTNGFNNKFHLSHIYKIIGYCPQIDVLLGELSCRETMTVFAMLRGISSGDVKDYVESCAFELDFIEHIDKPIKNLSGGNKRKVCTSLAIMGNVSVILLDEPTTGMDVVTKRNVWNVVKESLQAGKSILFSSHSMEDCEELCDRFTVLYKGNAKCLGTVRHLREKFCKGFELRVRLNIENENFELYSKRIRKFIPKTFKGAEIRDEYRGLITYAIPIEDILWSTLFDVMEKARRRYDIEYYSVVQTSLEKTLMELK